MALFFLKVKPLKEGRNSNQDKGHLGSRAFFASSTVFKCLAEEAW